MRRLMASCVACKREHPAKELSDEMSSPKVGSWKWLTTVARCLARRRQVVWILEWHAEVSTIETNNNRLGANSRFQPDRRSITFDLV